MTKPPTDHGTFRMYKARGQPGCWYGYVDINGVTYKIDAKHVGHGQDKHFEGSVKRDLKADQQSLPLMPLTSERHSQIADALSTAALSGGVRIRNSAPDAPPDFDDSLEKI